MTLTKRSASLIMFWPTHGLMHASMSAAASPPMGQACRWFLDTAVRSIGPKLYEDELQSKPFRSAA
jgi:hypothetical protein